MVAIVLGGTVMSDTITVFGSYSPSAFNVGFTMERVADRVLPEDLGISKRRFASLVDLLVVEETNSFHKNEGELITVDAIHSRSHKRRYAVARHMISHLLRHAQYSFPNIGKHLGRDHTTVMSGYERADALLDYCSDFSQIYKRVLRELERREALTRRRDWVGI